MIRIREITDGRDPALKAAYALLTKSFRRHERVSLGEWRDSLDERADQLLTDTAWHLLVAEEDGRVIGLNSGTFIGSLRLGVIGYLAIDPAARASGLGTRLRAHLRRKFERDAMRLTERPLEGILGEVSEHNPWLRSLARRANVLVLDFPYYQPSLAPEDAPSPFVLYLEQLGRVRQRIPVTELRRILYAVWRRGYRVSRPLERPAFRAMMRALESRRTVGRRTLAALEPS